jgi:bifunctional DNA-binding transcriptional regulator/antitoxin component of YhaV-PrlF toxin-antitoxin module
MTLVLKVSETGHLDLPADLRKSLGIEHGGPVSVWMENGELRMRAVADVLGELQEEGSKILAGDSVDRFIADRRREAARE